MNSGKYFFVGKIMRILTLIFFVISLLISIYFVYKYMNAYNLTPQEQSNWGHSIEPVGSHVEDRINEALV